MKLQQLLDKNREDLTLSVVEESSLLNEISIGDRLKGAWEGFTGKGNANDAMLHKEMSKAVAEIKDSYKKLDMVLREIYKSKSWKALNEIDKNAANDFFKSQVLSSREIISNFENFLKNKDFIHSVKNMKGSSSEEQETSSEAATPKLSKSDYKFAKHSVQLISNASKSADHIDYAAKEFAQYAKNEGSRQALGELFYDIFTFNGITGLKQIEEAAGVVTGDLNAFAKAFYKGFYNREYDNFKSVLSNEHARKFILKLISNYFEKHNITGIQVTDYGDGTAADHNNNDDYEVRTQQRNKSSESSSSTGSSEKSKSQKTIAEVLYDSSFSRRFLSAEKFPLNHISVLDENEIVDINKFRIFVYEFLKMTTKIKFGDEQVKDLKEKITENKDPLIKGYNKFLKGKIKKSDFNIIQKSDKTDDQEAKKGPIIELEHINDFFKLLNPVSSNKMEYRNRDHNRNRDNNQYGPEEIQAQHRELFRKILQCLELVLYKSQK